jgi:ketosteroid isomerase-like protein
MCRARNALLLTSLALLLTACRVGHNPRTDLADADSAAALDIRSTLLVHRDGLLRGDPRRVAPLFAPDARVSLPDSPDLIGTAGILTALRDFLGRGGAVTDVAVDVAELYVDGPVAFEMGTFEHRYRLDGGAEETARGRYMIRWERGPEARWRMARLLFNHVPPADESLQ